MKLILIDTIGLTEDQQDFITGEFPCISEGDNLVIPYSLHEHFIFQLELNPIMRSVGFVIGEIN